MDEHKARIIEEIKRAETYVVLTAYEIEDGERLASSRATNGHGGLLARMIAGLLQEHEELGSLVGTLMAAAALTGQKALPGLGDENVTDATERYGQPEGEGAAHSAEEMRDFLAKMMEDMKGGNENDG